MILYETSYARDQIAHVIIFIRRKLEVQILSHRPLFTSYTTNIIRTQEAEHAQLKLSTPRCVAVYVNIP